VSQGHCIVSAAVFAKENKSTYFMLVGDTLHVEATSKLLRFLTFQDKAQTQNQPVFIGSLKKMVLMFCFSPDGF